MHGAQAAGDHIDIFIYQDSRVFGPMYRQDNYLSGSDTRRQDNPVVVAMQKEGLRKGKKNRL
jgi:hypothetical protein